MKFVSTNPAVSITEILETYNISPLAAIIVAIAVALLIANKMTSRG